MHFPGELLASFSRLRAPTLPANRISYSLWAFPGQALSPQTFCSLATIEQGGAYEFSLTLSAVPAPSHLYRLFGHVLVTLSP